MGNVGFISSTACSDRFGGVGVVVADSDGSLSGQRMWGPSQIEQASFKESL